MGCFVLPIFISVIMDRHPIYFRWIHHDKVDSLNGKCLIQILLLQIRPIVAILHIDSDAITLLFYYCVSSYVTG